MKVRHDFVTNSSSSSFIISKNDITPRQIHLIKNHSEIASKLSQTARDMYDLNWYEEEWNIVETDTHLKGYTSMDNFSMRKFMEYIGLDPDLATWGEYDWYGWDEVELDWDMSWLDEEDDNED